MGKEKTKSQVGAPVKFSIEIFNEICNEIACSNKGLAKICKSKGIGAVTFYNHIKEVGNEHLLNTYTCAREMQADYMADEITEIADDGTNDTYIDDNGNQRTNQDVIARSKLRVEARKWIAAKLKPKKYGDKTDVDITSGGKELKQSVIINTTPEIAKNIEGL